MKLLVTGSGGREHALVLKFSENENIEKIYCAPGNGATALLDRCENVELENLEEIVQFAQDKDIDLTFPGAEDLLVEGIVDSFKKRNLNIFGPHKAAAMLEGSKSFAKDFMGKYKIRTADYRKFSSSSKALDYLETAEFPLVVKVDGLAAGKGVLICNSKNEAKEAVNNIMENSCFGDAGNSVVIEEFLEGYEASILSVYDGNNIVPFVSAKDHKKIGEGEKGLNTGGMGVVAPNPYVTNDVTVDFNNNILIPTLEGLKKEKLNFSGIIFFGLMITKKGIYLLEYNLRMGDPETQAVLPLLKSDLLDIIKLSLEGKLSPDDLEWSGRHSCAVVQASGGYPEKYEKGYEIRGVEGDHLVYIGGAELKKDRLLTSGGRVLTAVGTGDTASAAREEAYQMINKIHFKNHYFRKDIGNIK